VIQEVSSLAAAGKLNVHIDQTFPLDRAVQAQMYGEEGRTQGKIGLVVNVVEAGEK
jgi:NADPH:quinone reductase-like Zn-dependent oxidoreductase